MSSFTLHMGSESSKTLTVLPDGRIGMDGEQLVHGMSLDRSREITTAHASEEALDDFGCDQFDERSYRQIIALDVIRYACGRLGIPWPTGKASDEIRRVAALSSCP